mgnify:CR=1 FL=1
MFKKYIFSYRSNIIFFVLAIPLIILIILFRPFIKIKIGKINAAVIGEFLIPPENFLCELRSKKIIKKKNDIYIFFCNRPISNQYLLKNWKKYFIIWPRQIIEPIYYFFIESNFFRDFLCPWRHDHLVDYNKTAFYRQITDIHNLLPNYPVTLKFDKKEIETGEQYLLELGYKKNQKIVCFANRDGSFWDEEGTSTRNANIFTYKKSINYLADQNFFNIRMGRKNYEKIDFEKKNIFDYSFSKKKSDFNDFYIFSRCEFLISTDHGINEFATFFRKKKLVINFETFDKLHYVDENYTPLILPKKFLDLKTKKLVHYKEVYKKKLYQIRYKEELNKLGYDLIDNTEDEIYKSTIEMKEIIENKTSYGAKEQNNFWQIHEYYFNWKPKLIKISNSFFNDNIDLFC